MPSAAVLRVDPGDGQRGDRGERVGDVERAGERRLGGDRSPLGPTAVNVEPSGPTSTSSARQSASGWPSAEKVVTGTSDSVTQPAAVLVVEVDHPEPGAALGEQLRLGLEVVLHVRSGTPCAPG